MAVERGTQRAVELLKRRAGQRILQRGRSFGRQLAGGTRRYGGGAGVKPGQRLGKFRGGKGSLQLGIGPAACRVLAGKTQHRGHDMGTVQPRLAGGNGASRCPEEYFVSHRVHDGGMNNRADYKDSNAGARASFRENRAANKGRFAPPFRLDRTAFCGSFIHSIKLQPDR